jgi:zinc D-Ala-D-Ala carboxypeptidase
MDNISSHITYKEATQSDTVDQLGIVNEPDEKQLVCMQNLATRIFEPIRDHFGIPIRVTSFYRSTVLNKSVGGASLSQHLLGEAMDIDTRNYNGVTNERVFKYIVDNLEYDQCIAEDVKKDGSIGWVHVSLRKDNNRHQTLTMIIKDGKKQYEEYIT